MRLALRSTLSVLVLAVAAGSAGGLGGGTVTATAAGQAAQARPDLLLDFEAGPPRGRVASSFRNSGSGEAAVTVRRSGAGVVKVVQGRAGGRAARFPAYTGSSQGYAAVLATTPASRPTVDPGRRSFTFGATFRLDRRSSGKGPDNGDNLVQRGSFGGRGQFKLQLDHRVPSCRVKGDRGTLFVEARRAVTPLRWYSVNCRRTPSGITLRVRSFGSGAAVRSTHASGATGNLELGTYRLSIGGKTRANGAPESSADQFNGVLDNVFLRLR